MNGDVKKVLVVDDNPGVQKLMQRILERATFTVVLASSVAEAVDIAKSERPDVCLTDLQLPDADGFELVSLLRKQSEVEKYNTRFVMASGDDSVETRKKARELGLNDFLVKPVTPELLIQTISNQFN